MAEVIHVHELQADGTTVERDTEFRSSFIARSDFPGYNVVTVTVNHNGTHIYIEKDES